MERAHAAAEQADLFLVLGSSLVVYPAAALPIAAKRAGAALVIANREPTDLDPYADLVLRGDLVELLRPYAGLA
jgi:NAD-dependent deacetylase